MQGDSDMIDPEFDPYAMLQVHQEELARQHTVINQLIQANNNTQQTMLELSSQHQRLVELNQHLRHQIERQRVEINLIRTHTAVK